MPKPHADAVLHFQFNLRIKNGWLSESEHLPSENYGLRKENKPVDMIVIHAISLPPGDFGGGYIADFFCNQLELNAHPWFENIKGIKVSAHFLIDRTGAISQFVSTNMLAWHAGQSYWDGKNNCNDFSIGIELEGCDTIPFTDKQYIKLIALLKTLKSSYPLITDDRILGHSDISPGRKTDPGPCFSWNKIKHDGIST